MSNSMKDIPHCDAVQLHQDSDPLFAWSDLDAVPKGLLTTMTRVGMAMNAMASALDLSDELHHRPDGLLKTHFSQWLLISTAATTFEAILVFGKSAGDLRPLAERAIRMASESGNPELQGLKLDLLDKMGKIQGGKHPGSEALVRARNKLGFHFDDKDAHLTSTLTALPNRRAIWLEHHGDSPYGRVPLAADVLARAFFDSVSSDQGEMARIVNELLRQVLDITFTVHSVLRASLMGFLIEHGHLDRRR